MAALWALGEVGDVVGAGEAAVVAGAGSLGEGVFGDEEEGDRDPDRQRVGEGVDDESGSEISGLCGSGWWVPGPVVIFVHDGCVVNLEGSQRPPGSK